MRLAKLLLFLLAAFSLTQIKIVGYIGISEFCAFFAGSYLLVKNWRKLFADGFASIIVLAVLWIVSALASDWLRETEWTLMLRGVASPVMVLTLIPCFHALLRDNLNLARWAIVGFAVTVFLSTYIIPSGSTVGLAEKMGTTTLEAALSYKLTFLTLVMAIFSLIPQLWYLRLPLLSFVITLGLACFGLIEGGRSTFLSLLLSAGMMLVGGGKISRIRRVERSFIVIYIGLALCLLAAKSIYEFVAEEGLLGEEEQKKFEIQSESKIGLLSGRSQFVPIFLAIKDSPWLGHGSWAIDYQGYSLRAAEWLDDDQAVQRIERTPGIGFIPGHSHILVAYLWHGFFGGIFWLYVLTILWSTLRKYLTVVPSLFGFFVLTLPALFWAIFFSPFGNRVSTVMAIVVCLLVKRQYKMQNKRVRIGEFRVGATL